MGQLVSVILFIATGGATSAAIIVGSIFGTKAWYKHHPEDAPKRDLGRSNVIIQLDSQGLHHHDLRRLQHLAVDILDANTTLVTGQGFIVKGNLTVHEHDETKAGLSTGELVFQVPGLEAETHGKFILVNQTATDNQTQSAFNNVWAQLEKMPAGLLTGPTDAIVQKTAQEVVCAQLSAQNGTGSNDAGE